MAGLASLAERAGSNTDATTSDLLLAPVDSGGTVSTDEMFRFQYYPETITDTKAINYQKKDIPGGSLPIYQWVNSGERLISFSAVFTSDTALIESDGSFRNALAERQKTTGVLPRNVDVRSALAWLRRYTLPSYIVGGTETGVPLVKAPPRLMLCMPNTGIGLGGGGGNAGFALHAIHCLMTQCDVTYEAFFPSGLPRIATVQLAFVQIAQFAGRVSFPRVSQLVDAGTNNPQTALDFVVGLPQGTFGGYNLREKSKERV